MCNAWNHSASCNCGWGGVSYTQPSNSNSLLNTRLSQVIRSNSNYINLDSGEPKTYEARCWWCGESVFHHTNGNGDYVMFDSLGYPWKVHRCWYEYWESESERRRVLNEICNGFTIQQNKCLALKIVAALIPNVKVGKLNIYRAKESAVAAKMNYSIEDLRRKYGDVYSVNQAGEIILNSTLLENIKIKEVLCNECQEYVNENFIQYHRLHNCKFRKQKRKY